MKGSIWWPKYELCFVLLYHSQIQKLFLLHLHPIYDIIVVKLIRISLEPAHQKISAASAKIPPKNQLGAHFYDFGVKKCILQKKSLQYLKI